MGAKVAAGRAWESCTQKELLVTVGGRARRIVRENGQQGKQSSNGGKSQNKDHHKGLGFNVWA
jgi:hypothetical protein